MVSCVSWLMTKVDEPVGNLSRSLPRSPLSKPFSTSTSPSAPAPDGEAQTSRTAPDGRAARARPWRPCREIGAAGGDERVAAGRERHGAKRPGGSGAGVGIGARHGVGPGGACPDCRASPRFGKGPRSRGRGTARPLSRGHRRRIGDEFHPVDAETRDGQAGRRPGLLGAVVGPVVELDRDVEGRTRRAARRCARGATPRL